MAVWMHPSQDCIERGSMMRNKEESRIAKREIRVGGLARFLVLSWSIDPEPLRGWLSAWSFIGSPFPPLRKHLGLGKKSGRTLRRRRDRRGRIISVIMRGEAWTFVLVVYRQNSHPLRFSFSPAKPVIEIPESSKSPELRETDIYLLSVEYKERKVRRF